MRPTLTPEQCSPLGKFILDWTEQRGTTREAFARKCGLKSPVLRGAMLLGANPTQMTLTKIAHGLELSPVALESAVKLHSGGNSAKAAAALARKSFDVLVSTPNGEIIAVEAKQSAVLADAALELYLLLAEKVELLPENKRPSPNEIALMAATLAGKKKAA